MSWTGGLQEKYNAHGNMNVLLGWNCEVKKLMKFLKETQLFEEQREDEKELDGWQGQHKESNFLQSQMILTLGNKIK